MKNVKIYDVKSTSLANANALLAKNGKNFFWNASKFKSLKPNDYVFVVNRFEKLALLCSMTDVTINGKHFEAEAVTKFQYGGQDFSIQDKNNSYNQFVALEVIQSARIPEGWHFEKPLGQSETYDLQREGLKGNIRDRIQKLDDLRKIFPTHPATEILAEAEKYLNSINLNPYE